MKTFSSFFATGLAVLLAGSAAAQDSKPVPASPELERMKALVGTWHGKTDMGQGPMEFTVEYRLVSGGTVLEERIFAGSPKEMVTMYYDQGGKLHLTHYCMLGNRPAMALKSSDPKTVKFDFDPSCGIDAKADMHMHSLAITFEGPDTIVQEWQLCDAGKTKETHPFTLKRVKS